MTFIVATNVIASRPPERRPTGTPHARANSEALDLSVGPRFCSKCDYRAEDGYDLDGNFWSEHDDDESIFFQCKICDESFSFLNDLMMHKKNKHIEKVSFCRNFATNACVYGDESCCFVHEPEEARENNETSSAGSATLGDTS